jgi:hypothetical protein
MIWCCALPVMSGSAWSWPPAPNAGVGLVLADEEAHECIGDQHVGGIGNSATVLDKANVSDGTVLWEALHAC